MEVMNMTDGTDLRQQAIRRLKDRRDLQAHVLAYVLVNAALIGIWVVVGPAWLFWPAFPLLGWGIGLVFHAWNYFYGTRFTEEQIGREMQHLGGGSDTT
jgi:cyanate permease